MKNIFTKSMLRQPLKTVLLILLMAVASFSFVMRSVEYIVINERINEISGFFRAIGTLSSITDDLSGDVRPSADIISASPYVNFEDRRRTAEAVLLDMSNSYIQAQSFRFVGRPLLMPNDIFFYGTLIDIRHDAETYIVLSVEVDRVLLGYAEFVRAGQTLTVHYFMDIEEMRTGQTSVDGMVIGERYFLRGASYSRWEAFESESPVAYINRFVMKPLSEVTYGARERDLDRDGVWYVTANHGEDVDAAIPGLEELYTELRWLNYAQRRIRLQTTVDMSYIPLMRSQTGARAELTDGRWLTKDDNEYARPVVAVHGSFARIRGLSIGDTLRIGIPPEQRLTGGIGVCEAYMDIHVIGDIHAPYAHILELEIVGLFEFTGTSGILIAPWATTLMYIPNSVLPPDVNLIRHEGRARIGGEIVTIVMEEGLISNAWYSFVLHDPRDVDSFLLKTGEALEALGFAVEFAPSVEGARAFRDSAEQILQSVGFNMVLFSAIAFLVLALAAFLYLRQRQRDFAISRALGNPAGRTHRHLFSTLIFFALPPAIIGGVSGWFVALSEATNALEPLGGAANYPANGSVSPDYVANGTGISHEISILWLIVLIAAVLAGLLILTLLGSLKMSRRPVLELLQGTSGAKRTKKSGEPKSEVTSYADYSQANDNTHNLSISQEAQPQKQAIIPPHSTPTAKSNIAIQAPLKSNDKKRTYQLSFIFRHIIRQRAKLTLAAMIALFFVLALGFLQTTIERAEYEIDYLYNTTLVTGEIRQADPMDSATGRFWGNMITPSAAEKVISLVQNEYIESAHEFVVFTATDEDGILPENWDEIAGIEIDAFLIDNLIAFDPVLVGLNDLEHFARINSIGMGDDFQNFSWEPNENLSWVANWEDYVYGGFPGLQINFAEGFYPESFVLTEGSPIPIIFSNRIMGLRGFELGDVIYIGTTTMRDSRIWNHTPAVIVGTHNRAIRSHPIIGAATIPLEALEYIIGDELRYISMRFEIDPALNREMPRIQEEIENIIGAPGAGEVALRLWLHDDVLRMVVGPMEQNLSLLRLLYPVAIALSVIIGLGLSMLLMLQTAGVAAIMRVLGASRKTSRIMLCIEQMIICLTGLIIGIIILAITGWGFGFASSLLLAGLYFAGALTGAVLGAINVTKRPPLELLQVKE